MDDAKNGGERRMREVELFNVADRFCFCWLFESDNDASMRCSM